MRSSLPLLKSKSSKQWLARQFRDPYVQQRMAFPAHYRSRSAFKLLEMDATHHFITRLRGGAKTSSSDRHRPGPRVIVDLGAAPGGWSQVVALKSGYTSHLRPRQDEPADMQLYGLSQRAKLARRGAWSDQIANTEVDPPPPFTQEPQDAPAHADAPLPTIIALDLLRIPPIPGVHTLQADFLSPTASELIRMLLLRATNAPHASVDLLLSDMAANATGNLATDVAHSLRICDAVVRFAEQHLTVKSDTLPGGTLVLKYFVHPDTQQFCRTFLQPSFKHVYHAKPPASRTESAERYWICVNWLGGASRREVLPPSIPSEPNQMDLAMSRKRTAPQRDVSLPRQRHHSQSKLVKT